MGVRARAVFVNARVKFGSKLCVCVDGGAASLDDPPWPALRDLKAGISVESTPTRRRGSSPTSPSTPGTKARACTQRETAI